MKKIQYINNTSEFCVKNPDTVRGLYFPIAGNLGLKSVVTPTLGGDSKIDQNTFILEPESIENLHNNRSSRNFWLNFVDGGYWSAVGASAEAEMRRAEGRPEENEVRAGFIYHETKRVSDKYGVNATVLSFVPNDDNVEVMHVTITNTSDKAVSFVPFGAIPIYGRSADNIRDHRHVTSLLHRIKTTRYGVEVKPTLSFDERGHQKNHNTYYVYGLSEGGVAPQCFYPTVDMYIGESGTYTAPETVIKNISGVPEGTYIEGREAVGAMRFAEVTLKAGESVSYTILTGVSENMKEDYASSIIAKYDTKDKVLAAKNAMSDYWNEKVNIYVHTKDPDFDMLMRWICLQPFLRRIYGCSFLPHHDYGKGGRGWRDLWQDCLALLIMDPVDVRGMILSNFGGVRMDGTNATIIGSNPGEFVADRNGITRTWMDHGMWPMQTVSLYLDQSGDYSVFDEEVAYFKDAQVGRGMKMDGLYDSSQGTLQRTTSGQTYKGTVLEHLLLQHIGAVLETGAHGIIRLRDADWNDALDMAGEKGESVAFSCAYAGNLKTLAKIIRDLSANKNSNEVELLAELVDFINADSTGNGKFDEFLTGVEHTVSGDKKKINAEVLAAYLDTKADDLMNHIRENEWLNEGWYNSYYDNHGQRVEGTTDNGVRMMLTGQVFAIMSGTATTEQIGKITESADKYLYDAKIGGYRLNNDFHEEKYDMGRAFGFAFGEKENGAVFSHMAVMYAYSLYHRGFAREGFKALRALADTGMDFDTSHIYPGIPEYYNNDGRGLYSYLTGAGSWYALTMVTKVYGVRGYRGDLELNPSLVAEEFDAEGKASIVCNYAGSKLNVTYVNTTGKDSTDCTLSECQIDGINAGADKVDGIGTKSIIIPRALVEGENTEHSIKVIMK